MVSVVVDTDLHQRMNFGEVINHLGLSGTPGRLVLQVAWLKVELSTCRKRLRVGVRFYKFWNVPPVWL